MSAKFDKFLAKLVEKQSGGSGTANPVTWENVTGKPSDFPPEDHSHQISDVSGLQTVLNSKGTVKTVNGVTASGKAYMDHLDEQVRKVYLGQNFQLRRNPAFDKKVKAEEDSSIPQWEE